MYSGPYYLHVHQLVAEGIALMHKNGLDNSPDHRIPVCQNKLIAGHISYQELVDFLEHRVNGRNIYLHKMLFNMGSALFVISDIRNNQNSRNKNSCCGRYDEHD